MKGKEGLEQPMLLTQVRVFVTNFLGCVVCENRTQSTDVFSSDETKQHSLAGKNSFLSKRFFVSSLTTHVGSGLVIYDAITTWFCRRSL